jgi:hypothetical protein
VVGHFVVRLRLRAREATATQGDRPSEIEKAEKAKSPAWLLSKKPKKPKAKSQTCHP